MACPAPAAAVCRSEQKVSLALSAASHAVLYIAKLIRSEEPARPGPPSPAGLGEHLTKPSSWSLQRGANLFKEGVGEKAWLILGRGGL